ncbi:aminotransferase-like domain-containing protein [Streptomyces prunicolor]|uniref:PLP-dependent aminotransferase family protein n=1 Tax=Streptomyces prunicolor TaxID=67348 RepID=A0ABU4FP98_9ACTN|nr:PLP-dependent aminotransferase family protein [Streptomyces prunicolor]MCX5240985.1 PLP-dependent aminotransferase family protein [Streptomyces prunicolor]MCX5243631.1 PLP-dependent aminotransferase family protein [Streptomyces prunicolor]MDV7222402.1 PLP-dependent aminotransferase family protein [Streptomyces prunicolor]
MTSPRADAHPADLSTEHLHSALEDPALASMNFLNEVANRYPDAISFAPGRPFEEYFQIEDVHRYLRVFCEYLEQERGLSPAEVRRTLYQYGRTKGIVHELIARNLTEDEGITIDPESVVVTVGCQEAMYLVLRALRADERDVLLAVRPTYVGIDGAARLVDMPVLPVSGEGPGIDLDDLIRQVRRARAAGLRPRACYVMPDFANPSGTSLDLALRHQLLEIAEEEDFLLLEDNPYGLFNGGDDRVPTLKALDRRRRVVYLGSFAKTALPGARVGYAIADQRVAGRSGAVELLADQLSKIKSMLTVNTSPIAQAVVGGKLVEHGYSLLAANVQERKLYAANMTQLLHGLARHFPAGATAAEGISWNAPTGGFFAVVTLPFVADDALLAYSARRHGVLWTPMSHFYGGTGGHHQLRLATSLVTSEQIEQGLGRFAALVADRTRTDWQLPAT